MKKITEITETKSTTVERRNDHGDRYNVKVPIELRRKVETVQGWNRFGHYIIDLIIIVAIGTLVDLALSAANIDTFYYLGFNIGNYYYQLNITGWVVIVFYYTILESSMGRTIGKVATNSYVIDEFGNHPDVTKTLLRSLCRLIPFFAFSCLAERGWHDKWTNTYVVTKTEMETLRKALSNDYFSDDEELLDA